MHCGNRLEGTHTIQGTSKTVEKEKDKERQSRSKRKRGIGSRNEGDVNDLPLSVDTEVDVGCVNGLDWEITLK